jgi:hypothetical protein
MRERSLLRRYATSWKVAGSILDEAFGFFKCIPSTHTMVLGSTQLLIEMSARKDGKGRPTRKTNDLPVICELAV